MVSNPHKEVVTVVPLEKYLLDFADLLVAPFRNLGAVWLGIVPLYVSLVHAELFEHKVSYGRTIGNGFVMLWAGLNWAMHLSQFGMFAYFGGDNKQRMVIAWIVTATAVAVGVFTIVLGVRKKDRTLAGILGHARFSGYFLILLYPMQTGMIRWNWPSLASVLIFALPAWLILYLVGWSLRSVLK